ncbi:MAG TPA: plastocyanin/azurin family copper-binding protein [Gemmatimonadaceae bacterium]
MRNRLIFFCAPALLAAMACGGGGDSNPGSSSNTPTGPTTPTPTTPSAPQATDKVTISNNQFTPPDIQVSPGTTVTWTWAQDASTHNVTFNDGVGSGDKSSGVYTRTFSSGGTFPYSCTLHPGMTGTVTVK